MIYTQQQVHTQVHLYKNTPIGTQVSRYTRTMKRVCACVWVCVYLWAVVSHHLCLHPALIKHTHTHTYTCTHTRETHSRQASDVTVVIETARVEPWLAESNWRRETLFTFHSRTFSPRSLVVAHPILSSPPVNQCLFLSPFLPVSCISHTHTHRHTQTHTDTHSHTSPSLTLQYRNDDSSV